MCLCLLENILRHNCKRSKYWTRSFFYLSEIKQNQPVGIQYNLSVCRLWCLSVLTHSGFKLIAPHEAFNSKSRDRTLEPGLAWCHICIHPFRRKSFCLGAFLWSNSHWVLNHLSLAAASTACGFQVGCSQAKLPSSENAVILSHSILVIASIFLATSKKKQQTTLWRKKLDKPSLNLPLGLFFKWLVF